MKPQLVRLLADRDIEILYSSTPRAEVYIGKQVFQHSLYDSIIMPLASLSSFWTIKYYVPMWFIKNIGD